VLLLSLKAGMKINDLGTPNSRKKNMFALPELQTRRYLEITAQLRQRHGDQAIEHRSDPSNQSSRQDDDQSAALGSYMCRSHTICPCDRDLIIYSVRADWLSINCRHGRLSSLTTFCVDRRRVSWLVERVELD